MVADLRCQGYKRIRAVDIKPLDEWYQVFEDADNLIPDLNLKENCARAAERASAVYNRPANTMEAYLSRTIESVLSQDYPNIEYIVMDDESTDAPSKFSKAMATGFVTSANPTGPSDAVHKGFQQRARIYNRARLWGPPRRAGVSFAFPEWIAGQVRNRLGLIADLC